MLLLLCSDLTFLVDNTCNVDTMVPMRFTNSGGKLDKLLARRNCNCFANCNNVVMVSVPEYFGENNADIRMYPSMIDGIHVFK